MLPVPFWPPPKIPVEMPNHSPVIVRCLGTVTATLITRCSPGRRWYLGGPSYLESAATCPLMVGAKVTLSVTGGHEASCGQREDEEQPTAAKAPARNAATRTNRRVSLTRPV